MKSKWTAHALDVEGVKKTMQKKGGEQFDPRVKMVFEIKVLFYDGCTFRSVADLILFLRSPSVTCERYWVHGTSL
jgi:hypothetical protein